jgi:hypothetical protein
MRQGREIAARVPGVFVADAAWPEIMPRLDSGKHRSAGRRRPRLGAVFGDPTLASAMVADIIESL